MDKEISYTEAFKKLQDIVQQMENADISIDDLTENVKEASRLIRICKDKLTKTEEEVNKTISELS